MEEKDLQLLEETKNYVKSISNWTLFLGIMTIISAVTIFFCGLIFIIIQSFMDYLPENYPYFIVGIIYILMSGVYVIPIIYLFRIHKASSNAIQANSNEQIVFALQNIKSLFKFRGILIIIGIALCVIAIPIVAIIVALA